MAVLGAVGAVAIMADVTWWPGVISAILLLSLKELPSERRRAGLIAGLAALAIVTLPSRLSVAHQSSGDGSADVTLRSTQARNLEFIGAGHGAPPTRAAYDVDPFSGRRVGLGDYVFGDHSLSVVVGGTLGGIYDGLTAQADRPETGLAGLLSFILQIVGVVFLLAVPRLRLLVLVPAVVALVPWFLADRTEVSQFLAQAAFWPGMLAGVAALGYAGWQIARRRVPVDRWFAEAREHAPLLGRRAGRSQEPASP
jgi:hypothetical protein